jgi:hypothetical protein
MEDRLRHIIDVLVDIDDPAAELARRAHLSRLHLDRVSAAIPGESPAAFRRRLLLERGASELTRGHARDRRGARRRYSSLGASARRDAWDTAFVDATCDPPVSFTFGAAVAHVLTRDSYRRQGCRSRAP